MKAARKDTVQPHITDNPSFFPGTNIQQYVDPTSIDLLDTCPHKYYLAMIEDWRTKKEKVDLAFGRRFASRLENYHKRRAGVGLPAPMSHEEALLITVREAIQDPWDSDDTTQPKNRSTLIRSIVWYLDQFADDPCQTLILADGTPAVELSFKIELPYRGPNGDPYILCGHIDRIATFMGKRWVMDNKTTKTTVSSNYFKKYKMDTQMTVYTIAGQAYAGTAAGVIVDAAQVAVNFTRFLRGHTLRQQSHLDEFITDLGVLLEQARGYAEQNYWPRRRSACDKYGGCQFRDVCGSIPGIREQILQSNFQRERWNPREPR